MTIKVVSYLLPSSSSPSVQFPMPVRVLFLTQAPSERHYRSSVVVSLYFGPRSLKQETKGTQEKDKALLSFHDWHMFQRLLMLGLISASGHWHRQPPLPGTVFPHLPPQFLLQIQFFFRRVPLILLNSARSLIPSKPPHHLPPWPAPWGDHSWATAHTYFIDISLVFT